MLYSAMKFELKKNSSILFRIFWKYNSLWCILGVRIFKNRIKNDFSRVRKVPVNRSQTGSGQMRFSRKHDNYSNNKLSFFLSGWVWVFPALGTCMMCKSRLTKGTGRVWVCVLSNRIQGSPISLDSQLIPDSIPLLGISWFWIPE